MPKRKSARLIALDFINAVMEKLVPAHEKLCDEGKCTLEDPCPYCQIQDLMMSEYKKL